MAKKRRIGKPKNQQRARRLPKNDQVARTFEREDVYYPGWLCWCGHYNETDGKCRKCGATPPEVT